jgi:hyperosmotically inducible protein
MKVRTALMTAAVSLALAGLAGCGDEPDTTTSRAPDTTTTTPPATTTPTTPPAATTTPPAGDATATAPAPGATTPATGDGADRSAGQTVDDATVTAKVKAALMAEDGVDGTKINVDTFNGRVTLKGEVPKNMIDRAVQVAKGIEGVKDVDNRLSASGAG